MTNDKIINAARAYRDAYARERAPGAIPTGETKQFEVELLALCREMMEASDLPKDVPSAVSAWKALQDGQRVMCARGYQWTAHRTGGRLRFTMAKQDGRPGKTLEQPWYPCIVGELPVWPIVIEAAEPVTC